MSHIIADSPTVHGQLAEKRDGMIVLALPHTEYRLHLVADTAGALKDAAVGKPIAGRITAHARRVDVVTTGGRFIEPLYGRPRRVQGRIIATDSEHNTITVNAACPVVCHLLPLQKAEQFAVGQLVGFDVEKGATFEL